MGQVAAGEVVGASGAAYGGRGNLSVSCSGLAISGGGSRSLAWYTFLISFDIVLVNGLPVRVSFDGRQFL